MGTNQLKLAGLLLAATGLPIATAPSTASAVLVYSDNFDGPAATPLDGFAPDVRPGTEVWASNNLNADGTVGVTGRTNWLPFATAPDMKYTATFTVDIGFQASSVTAGYFGFTEENPFDVGNIIGTGHDTYGIIGVYRGGGYGFLPTYNPAPRTVTVTGANGTLFTSSPNDYQVKLVLTTSSSANHVLSVFLGGTQIDLNGAAAGLDYQFASARSFTGIGMGFHSAAAGAFVLEGFTLEAEAAAPVPEPATAGLFAAGAAMLLSARRR